MDNTNKLWSHFPSDPISTYLLDGYLPVLRVVWPRLPIKYFLNDIFMADRYTSLYRYVSNFDAQISKTTARINLFEVHSNPSNEVTSDWISFWQNEKCMVLWNKSVCGYWLFIWYMYSCRIDSVAHLLYLFHCSVCSTTMFYFGETTYHRSEPLRQFSVDSLP